MYYSSQSSPKGPWEVLMSEACLKRNGKDIKRLLENVRMAREALRCSTTESKNAMEQRLEDALRELADFCRIYDSLA
jgi:hypothetical protein